MKYILQIAVAIAAFLGGLHFGYSLVYVLLAALSGLVLWIIIGIIWEVLINRQ